MVLRTRSGPRDTHVFRAVAAYCHIAFLRHSTNFSATGDNKCVILHRNSSAVSANFFPPNICQFSPFTIVPKRSYGFHHACSLLIISFFLQHLR